MENKRGQQEDKIVNVFSHIWNHYMYDMNLKRELSEGSRRSGEERQGNGMGCKYGQSTVMEHGI